MRSTTDFNAEKIWDIPRPPHNGEVHPDLIRYKDYFFCQFQEHGGNRIICSVDGRDWETVQLGRIGFMFSTTSSDQLMLIGMRRDIQPERPDGKLRWQSFTRLSDDGLRWSHEYTSPAALETCMYRVTWHNGVGYSVGYGRKDATGTLYRTEDGRDWQPLKKDFYPEERNGNEAELAFDISGKAYCVLRGPYEMPVTIGVSKDPDYQKWEWTVPQVDWFGDGKTGSADDLIRAPFGGPKCLRLKDGRLIAYGRVLGPETNGERSARSSSSPVAGGDSNDPTGGDEDAVVTLLELDPSGKRMTRLMDFPGYTHYHGVVEHDGHFWITCGRCGNASEVWLLKAPVPPRR